MKLSTSSCRINLEWLAPIEARIAISFCRAVARASRRLATLLHAIRSNIETAAISAYSMTLNCPTTWSVKLVVFTSKVFG